MENEIYSRGMAFQKSGPGLAPRSTQAETVGSGLTEDKRIEPEYFLALHIKPQKLQDFQAGA